MQALLTAVLTSYVIDDPKPVSAVLWRKAREVMRESADPGRLEAWARNLAPADCAAIVSRLELLDAMERLLGQLSDDGIEVVSEFDEPYPQRLIERLNGKHPAMFFVAGSRALLSADSVGVVGSRDVDDEATSFAHEVAAEAVGRGLAIVSGGARGIDLESMRAALDAGGGDGGLLGRLDDQAGAASTDARVPRRGSGVSGQRLLAECGVSGWKRHGAQQVHLRALAGHRGGVVGCRDGGDVGRRDGGAEDEALPGAGAHGGERAGRQSPPCATGRSAARSRGRPAHDAAARGFEPRHGRRAGQPVLTAMTRRAAGANRRSRCGPF